MGKIYTTDDKVFKPTYRKDDEGIFKTTFKEVSNRQEVEPGIIIIFDGGDVYGYEKDLENCI